MNTETLITGELMEALKRHQFQQILAEWSGSMYVCRFQPLEGTLYLVPDNSTRNDLWAVWYFLKGNQIDRFVFNSWPMNYTYVGFTETAERLVLHFCDTPDFSGLFS